MALPFSGGASWGAAFLGVRLPNHGAALYHRFQYRFPHRNECGDGTDSCRSCPEASCISRRKAGCCACRGGLLLLCGNGSWQLNRGDVLAAVCAVCISLHLICIGEYVRRSDFYWLTVVQLGVVALLSYAGAINPR